MELEELKASWAQMSSKFEHQQKLTDKMIAQVVKVRYTNKLNTIIKYEGTASLVLLAGLFVLLRYFHLFDTLALQLCAVISMLLMTVLPTLSLTSLYRMNSLSMAKRDHNKTMQEYTRRRTFFLLIQRLNIVLSLVFMITMIPLIVKISGGKDVFAGDSTHLIWFLPIGIILLLSFGRWGYQCYANITADAQEILGELEDSDYV